MYKKVQQLSFNDFVFPYGELNQENEWIKLAAIVPWDVAEQEYAKLFVDNGAPAHSVRIALGACIIKQRLKCSDEWTVRHISENPYLQYFLGMKEYSNKCPFGASTMVDFRKRFPPEVIAALLKASTPDYDNQDKHDNNHDDQEQPPQGGDADSNDSHEQAAKPNQGSLLMDATCCPADISFPQDFQLLNECREHLEKIIDSLCKANGIKHPRMRRNCARRDYLRLSKSKKRTVQAVRKAVRKQLAYIRRDIGFIIGFVLERKVTLGKKFCELLNTLTLLYEQQLYMYENNKHSVPDRIVSISQPWIRPIVRGKAHANTEFGAKLHISMVNGYARIERLSFDAFNEATDFFSAVEAFREEHGCYPKRVLADKIYRNRETISWCKERGIQLTGPALGRPSKDAQQTKEAKRQEYQDICDRNAVEGEFGVGKRSYGLNRIMAHLPETSFCVIGIALLCMNLAKRLRSLLRGFLRLLLYCPNHYLLMESA